MLCVDDSKLEEIQRKNAMNGTLPLNSLRSIGGG